MSWLNGFLRLVSRIGVRLLAFNLLLVFLPIGGLLHLRGLERELLSAQDTALRVVLGARDVDTRVRFRGAQPIALVALLAHLLDQVVQGLARGVVIAARIVK